MESLKSIFLIVTVVISFFLIMLVLFQKNASGGASSALMGGRDVNLFSEGKERGSEKIISFSTLSLVILFITLALVLRL